MKKLFLFLLVGQGFLMPAFAQDDDLMKTLDQQQPQQKVYTSATFKGTRLISGHSVETVKGKHLDFLISHRFGRINSGSAEFFGLDAATLRLGLEYGVSDRFTIGLGRSSYQKIVDLYGKYRLIRQSSGAGSTPISVTLFASNAMVTEATQANSNGILYYNNGERQNFTGQLLIARKFSESLSLQLMPTVLSIGKVESGMSSTMTALGVGGRYKLSKRVSLNAEYYYRFVNNTNDKTYGGYQAYNAFSIGFDIETGGHVFQLHFTNSQGMIEKQFITQTTGNFFKGDIHYGFNISRVFSFDKRAKKINK